MLAMAKPLRPMIRMRRSVLQPTPRAVAMSSPIRRNSRHRLSDLAGTSMPPISPRNCSIKNGFKRKDKRQESG